MNSRVNRVVTLGTVVLCAALPYACGNGGRGKGNAAERASAAPVAQAKAKTPFVPLDACSLFTKAEVEALVGKPAMDPRKEQMANLTTCEYGQPGTRMLGGRPFDKVLGLTVFTGEEGTYYAGAAGQARDAYETARKNAGDSEDVAGLGEKAYWNKDFKSLSAYKGKYFVTVDEVPLEVARKVMSKAIDRLP